MSDSHTAFNSSSFSAGAVGGALTVAGAMVSGLQAVVQANREACARWDRDQLAAAYCYTDLMLHRAAGKNAELKRENERLRRLVKSLTLRPAARAR
jgi:hypothetical protein